MCKFPKFNDSYEVPIGRPLTRKSSLHGKYGGVDRIIIPKASLPFKVSNYLNPKQHVAVWTPTGFKHGRTVLYVPRYDNV